MSDLAIPQDLLPILPVETVAYADTAWRTLTQQDRVFLVELAAELKASPPEAWWHTMQYAAMGYDNRHLYKPLQVGRNGGDRARGFARLLRNPDVRSLLNHLGYQRPPDLVEAVDNRLRTALDVIDREMQGDPDITAGQSQTAWRIFHMKFGRPRQQIDHRVEGSITYADVRGDVKQLTDALTARGAIIDAEFTDPSLVAEIEPGAGDAEHPGHAPVHPESETVADISE